MCSIAGLPSPGSNVTVLVTRVNSNPLCVMVEFWGNFNTEKRHIYEQMRKEIQCYGERFREGEGDPGDQCLVQICETWYRARVVSRMSSNYSVFLFDEGKTLNVKTNMLAWGKREHFLLPSEVELCVLANVLPLSPENKWSPMALEFLRSLCGKMVNACVQEVFVPHRTFLLDIPSLSRQILEMGFAKKLAQDRFREFVFHHFQPSVSDSLSRSQASSQSTSDKSTEVRHPETQLNYMYPELQPEMVETVVITEVTNPSRVFCQLKVFSQELMKLTEQITKHYEGRVGVCPPPATLGSPCAARGPDGKWYRAVLQQVIVSNNVAEVLQVDYGKKHFTQIDSIRHLAAEFFRMPVVTYVCSLHGVIDKGVGWTASQIDYLKSLLLNKTLIAKFEYQSLSEGVHYVTLIGAGSRNLNKEFGTQAECLLESEKVHVDYNMNKTMSQRLRSPNHGDEKECKSNMPKESLVVNTKHKAVVQYVKSPSEFWVQIQKYADEFDQMMDDLSELYCDPASAEGLVRSPTIGLYCAALSRDGSYYRANVCEVTDRQTVVNFVDYGNTETVDRHNIRHLPSKYQVLPPLALKCGLAGIAPVCDGWSVKALNLFSDLVMDRVLDLNVVGKTEDLHVVHLSDPTLDGEKDLFHLMCTAGLARREDTTTKPMTKLTQRPQAFPQVPKVRVIESETKSEASSGSGAALPKASRSVFKEYLFQIGSSLEVFVSHIDSPNDFWCQIARNIGHLKLLMQDIQTHYKDSEYQELTEAACVARHPKTGMWYRALVIYKHQTPHVDVLFIDYGQTRKVALQELRPINPSFLKLNGQAFRCRLYNLIHPLSYTDHEWDANATHLFQEFVDEAASMNITLKCTIYAVMYDMQKVVFNVVDLETPFQSVCSLLVKKGLAMSTPPKKAPVPPFRLDTYYYSTHNLKMGSEEEVVVTTVKSVNQFYCQLRRNTEVVQNLADQVNLLCHQLESVQCPKTFGTVCFAKYIDGEWYRGQIKSTNPSIVVNFVDYGDTIDVQKSDLLPIPIEAGEIMSIPVQAIECGLSDISVDVPSEVNMWFEKYVIDHFLKAVIVAKEPNGKLLVELYDGKTQVNRLLKEKFATEMQRKRLDGALEQDTSVIQNTVGRDIARFESKVQVEDDWRKRHTQSTSYREIDGRNASKLDLKPQANGVWQRQQDSTRIPFNKGDGPSLTKFESKAPISDTQGSFNRGDGQNQGSLYSRTKVDVCKEQDPSSFSSRNGKSKTGMEPGRAVFSDVSGSGPAESRVKSSKPAKHNTPDTSPAQSIKTVILSKNTTLQALPKLSDLPSKSIVPGTESDVYVSHCNSPLSFFVQLVSDEDEIFSLVETLNNDQDTTPLSVKDLQEGNLVNAQFLEDESWYRAVIKTEVGSDVCNVEFIDFGNTARVPSSKICSLAQPHLGHPRLSIHCFLSGSMTSERYSDDFKNEIDGIDGAIHCTFMQKRDTGWEVTLEANGKRLGDSLHTRDSTSDLPASKEASLKQDGASSESATQALAEVTVVYKRVHLSEGQSLNVFASTINGPESFWCQYSEKLQEISGLAQEVGNAPDLKPVNMGSLHSGNACLALFAEDEQWYRGEILSKELDVACVLFVDYGNESFVNFGKVRELPLQLQDIPPQAFLCQLDGFQSSQGSWKNDAADHFFDLLNDKLLKVTVVKPTQLNDGGVSYIVKIEYQDQIINDLMKEYWCSSSGNGEITESPSKPASEPAVSCQSTRLVSELETAASSAQEELTSDMGRLPQEVSGDQIVIPEAQDDKPKFSETMEEGSDVPVLPVEKLSEHEKEVLEKDLVADASSCNLGESFMMETTEHLMQDVVQKVISNVVEALSSAEASEESVELDKFVSSTVFVLEQDLNESTRILCIDESYESSASHYLDAEGHMDGQAHEDLPTQSTGTPAVNPEGGENNMELFDSDFGKLRRTTGSASVGEECIVWSQASQNWCRAKVLSISKETLLVLLLEQDSQMTVDPLNVFKAIPQEKTQNAPVDTESPLSDDLTPARNEDTQVKADVVVDPLECVSADRDQPEEFQSDESASLDDHKLPEKPISVEEKPESFDVQTHSTHLVQQEEALILEQDSEITVDPQYIFEAISENTQNAPVDTDSPLSDDLTLVRSEDNQATADVVVDPLECVSVEKDQREEFQSNESASLDDHKLAEKPDSIEEKLESFDKTHSVPLAQQEEDKLHECQADVEGLVGVLGTAEIPISVADELVAETDSVPSTQQEEELICECQLEMDATFDVSQTSGEPSSIEEALESNDAQTDVVPSSQQEDDLSHECQPDTGAITEVHVSETAEELPSIEERLESHDRQTDSVPLAQQEEDIVCECQTDVDATVEVSVTTEALPSVEDRLEYHDEQTDSVPSTQQEEDFVCECQTGVDATVELSVTAEELPSGEEQFESHDEQTDSVLSTQQEEDIVCECQTSVDATIDVPVTAEEQSIEDKRKSCDVQTDPVPSVQQEEDLLHEYQAVDVLIDTSNRADLHEDPSMATDAVDPPAAEKQMEQCLSAEEPPAEVILPAAVEAHLDVPEISAEQNQEEHEESVLRADPHESASQEADPSQETQPENSPAEQTGNTEQNPELQRTDMALLELLDFSPERKTKVKTNGYHDDETGDANATERADDIPVEVDLIDLTSDTEDSDTASDDTVKDISEEAERRRIEEGQTLDEVLSEVTHLSLRAESVSGDDGDDDSVIFVGELKAPSP